MYSQTELSIYLFIYAELTRFDSLHRFRILRCVAGTGGVGGRQRERLPRKWVFLLAGSVESYGFWCRGLPAGRGEHRVLGGVLGWRKGLGLSLYIEK